MTAAACCRTAAAAGAVLLLVLPAPSSFAEGGPEAEAASPGTDQFRMTESLGKLLSARDEKGAATVDGAAHDYFEALPVHAKELFAKQVEDENIGDAGQLRDLLSLDLDSAKLELVLTNNCVLCHTNPQFHDPPTLFSLDPVAAGSPPTMSLRKILDDTHFRHNLSCAGCHGGDPTAHMAHEHPDEWPADRDERFADPKWIPGFCSRCHADPKYMGSFDPSLPTDQMAKYRSSHHGRALLEDGNQRAAQCVSCHGVHGIQPASNPASSVNAKNVPETCGKCHGDAAVMAGVKKKDGSPIPTDQLAKYKSSVHGRALLEKGDAGAPACNDCHGNHAAAPAEVASVAQICRTCHSRNGTLFDGSRHKQVFEKNGWPECERCHGNHAIAKTSDDMLLTTGDSLCAGCHDEHARDNPDCKTTAVHFRDTILRFAAATAAYDHVSRDLAEKGLDVETLDDERRNLDDALAMSRSAIHSFDRSDFDEIAAKGNETIVGMNALVDKAEAEYSERRSGLLTAIAALALLAVGLWWKIRALGRDAGS